MNLLSNTLTREVSEIVKALPAKKLTYSAFIWSAPATVFASILTTSDDGLSEDQFFRWILILLIAHLAMLPFVIYGQEARAQKIQFPLLALMAVTRGFAIAILEPLFKIDLLLPLYLEILNSVIVLFYTFSIFAIVNFFRITVRDDIRGVIEESMLQQTDLTQLQFEESYNGLVDKIVEVQRQIVRAAGSNISRETLQERARDIDALIRDHIRPLSHSEWRKGELVHIPGGFGSILRSALSRRLIPVLGVSFFAIPFYLKYSTIQGGLLKAVYTITLFNILVAIAWLWSHKSARFSESTIYRRNRAFLLSLALFVFPIDTSLMSILPIGQTQWQNAIRQDLLLYLFLTLFCLLAVLSLQLIEEEKAAIGLIRDQLKLEGKPVPIISGQSSSASREFAQYLHAEVHSQLLGCKLLLLKAAEDEVPQFTPEMLRLINQRLEALVQPYSPGPEKSPSLRISEFIDSWAGIVQIKSALSPEIDECKEAGTYAAQIIEESVVNAVRHGQATEIQILLRVGKDEVEISILNNGSLLESKSETGLGSLLFDTFTSEWSIGIKDSLVSSHFKIPRR